MCVCVCVSVGVGFDIEMKSTWGCWRSSSELMDEEDGKGTLLSLDSAACNGVCVCVFLGGWGGACFI